ncbi:hypothetical protein [Streptomyces blattellae]|uniref:hypothetical protein n=1 Tax=Streptomyces blattellae TaxID=2569855 RepID=UPI0012B740DF|nr:hypothetical protein [Streptomyces blattellae]
MIKDKQRSPLARIYWRPATAQLLVQDAHGGGTLCSAVETSPATHDVYTPEGAALARVEFRRGRFLPWPRRTRWTVTLPSGSRITGKKGTWYAWTLCIGFFPLWFPAGLAMRLYSFWEGESEIEVNFPRRTRWYGPAFSLLLDYRGISEPAYHLKTQHVDYRLAFVLATIKTQQEMPNTDNKAFSTT